MSPAAGPRALGTAAGLADPARSPVVALHAASVRYGPLAALSDITLQVHAGDRIALVGPNGAGKTTLLRALHGLVPLAGGRLTHGAAPAPALAASGPASPAQAMVFQQPFLLRLSVLTNLRVALWLAGVPAAERVARARAALQRVGLDGLQDRPARKLSGGQQQRLAFARAWALRPRLLLLDEPTASLDPQAKHEVETLIDVFAREGMTVVLSTHNLGQAKRLATRVVHLDAGRITVDRPTDEFFHAPLPETAARFLKGELL